MGRLAEVEVAIYCVPSEDAEYQERLIQEFRSAADALSSIDVVEESPFFVFKQQAVQKFEEALGAFESNGDSFAFASSDHFGNRRPYEVDFVADKTYYTLDSENHVFADICEGKEEVERLRDGFEGMVESGFFEEGSGVFAIRQMLTSYLIRAGKNAAVFIFSRVIY